MTENPMGIPRESHRESLSPRETLGIPIIRDSLGNPYIGTIWDSLMMGNPRESLGESLMMGIPQGILDDGIPSRIPSSELEGIPGE